MTWSGPADHRRPGRPELDLPSLPRPTTTRLLQLVLLLSVGAAFAAYWWLVLEQRSWPGAYGSCLRFPLRAGFASDIGAYARCVARVQLLQEVVVLSGPAILLALSAAILVAASPVQMRLWDTRPASPDLTARLDACLPEFSLEKRPSLVIARRARASAWSYGRFPRYGIAVRRELSLLVAGHAELVDATLRHELAHLKARDVDRTWLALYAWAAFIAVVAIPLAADAVLRPGTIGFALGWRLVVLAVLVQLATLAVLRTREHDADLLACAAAGSQDAMAVAIRQALPRQAPGPARPAPGRNAWQRHLAGLRWALQTHPAAQRRLDVIGQPGLLWRISVLEFLVTGLVSGAVFDEIALFFGYLMPADTSLAYWLAGAVTGLLASGIAVPAIWRDTAASRLLPPAGGGAEPRRLPGWGLPGAALGAGVLLGSQLSPRAAADWIREFPTAASLASDVSLSHADPRAVAVLAAAALAGGVLFCGWAAAIARPVLAIAPDRALTTLCLAAASAGGLVVAVPLGAWFLVCRDVSAARTAAVFAGVLDDPAARIALLASAGLGLLVLIAACRGLRVRWMIPAVTVLATLIAGPPLAAALINAHISAERDMQQLPLLPPGLLHGTAPMPPYLACAYLEDVVPTGTAPGGTRQLGSLLLRTPDPVLRAIGHLLHPRSTGPASGRNLAHEIDNAETTALTRCDVVFRYG